MEYNKKKILKKEHVYGCSNLEKKNSSSSNSCSNRTTHSGQLDLAGKMVKNKIPLNKNQLNVLRIFYHNSEAGFSYTQLVEIFVREMNQKTVQNVIAKLRKLGLIRCADIIKGKSVNNAYMYIKSKDTYETGIPVTNKHVKYNIITDEGKRAFELNGGLDL